MSNIFITGAASGLGKAFVHAYAAQNTENKVYALDRAFPKEHDGSFLGLPQSPDWIHQHIFQIECDVTEEAAVSALSSRYSIDELDVVIHSAGVRGLNPRVPLSQYTDVAKAENLSSMDAATLQRTFEINVVGTFLLLKALLPLIRKSGASLPRVVVMGSRMGSIGHNTELGGAYAYRASKAALNAVVKSFSVDVPGVVWVIMHPGRVESGLVAIREDEAMNVDEVVRRDLMPLIRRFGKEDSGRFMDRFGEDIPW